MPTVCIPHNEVIAEGLSFTDPDGRLFKWNGELLRGIPSERGAFCRHLFNSGIMRELIDKNLFVETELTPLQFDQWEIVLKHRTVPFISYPQEWCDLMLKDAALHQLDFCIELAKHKLLCEDAHPLNILFDGCQPVFVDFGSISPVPDDGTHLEWLNYEQFSRAFTNPLRLMAQGYGRIAHWLMHDYERSVLISDLKALTGRPGAGLTLLKTLANRLSDLARRHTPAGLPKRLIGRLTKEEAYVPDSFDFLHTRRGLLKRVRQEVENVKLPGVRATMPQGREGSRLREVASGNDSRSQRILSTVLSDLAPETVLDIGRDGHCMDYPLMAARYASRVVAVNSDEYRVRRMYGLAKTHNTPILSLQIDFFSPSCDLSNYWFRPVSDRLRCDMVLALDLLDCLVRQNIRFDLITERLSSLSKRWLLVDYVPQPNERRADPDRFPYTWTALDTLITELRKRFRTVSTVPSQAESRVFLLCEK